MPSVVLFPLPDADRTALRVEVARHVAAAYGELVRLCPTCGSDAHGRPRVAGRPDLHLSISYADGLAALAVAGDPIGVDVEAEAGRRIPVDRSELVAWTRAEAALKLAGDGVRGAPPAGATVVALTGLPTGYVGALATWGDQTGNGGSAASYSQGRSSSAMS